MAFRQSAHQNHHARAPLRAGAAQVNASHLPFTPLIHTSHSCRVVCCVVEVLCVVLFLLCVCVCDLFLFTPPIHTAHSHLPFTPPIHNSYAAADGFSSIAHQNHYPRAPLRAGATQVGSSHCPFTPPIHTSHSCRVVCCGVVVLCVVLFLLCVCVCDMFLFTPPIHTSHAHLPFTPPIHTSHSQLPFTPHMHPTSHADFGAATHPGVGGATHRRRATFERC